MHGSLRGASQYLTGREESSRGGAGVGHNSCDLALSQTLPDWGGVGGGVGMPLPLLLTGWGMV